MLQQFRVTFTLPNGKYIEKFVKGSKDEATAYINSIESQGYLNCKAYIYDCKDEQEKLINGG